MLDLDALTKRVATSEGMGPKPDAEPVTALLEQEGAEAAPYVPGEAGARLRTAWAHGDDDAIEQAILDIVHRGR